ncbi:MurR/RpiR family transcriptional regulator [Oscillospiraceae bacterium MB08-C2-2]|nr:MurR/RpiR family transcriptional regulator [Oscillospiraceae bacterium MB08-C2-2]
MKATKSCRIIIENRKQGLTKTEKRLADYILENMSDVLGFTVTELAEKSGTSDATVVRFCKNIGFKGYQDFKICAAVDTLPPNRHLSPNFNSSDDAAMVCQKVFTSEIDVLNETLMMLDIPALEQTAKAMAQAEKIAFFGSGGSNLVATDAQHKLLKIGHQVLVHGDADSQAMCASILGEKDLAFGISHSGSNRQTVHCLKLAKENGAFTVGLTTQGKNPLSKAADIVLYTSTKETVFRSESVTARIAQLAMLDSLIAMIALCDYDKSYKAIQMTRNATSEGKY